MDAGLMCECILTNDRLVTGDRHAGDLRDQSARRIEPRRIDVRRDTEEAFASLQCHRNLFERAIACTLADAVDRALDLTSAGANRCKTVRNSHSQIVMAMDGEGDLVDA